MGLDAASHQPLLLAVAEDKSLHLWDWLRKSCVVAAQLLEEPLCCALHPGGSMALVGSGEQLRMYYLLRVSQNGHGMEAQWGGWVGALLLAVIPGSLRDISLSEISVYCDLQANTEFTGVVV